MKPEAITTLAPSLWIPRPLRARIECALQNGPRHACCGVLIGQATRERVEVKRLVDAENLALQRCADCPELDPLALFRAERKAHELGLCVVGIWIGRDAEEARPTRVDLALAWEGWSYLLAAGGAQGLRELRSWRLVGGDFEEEPVITS